MKIKSPEHNSIKFKHSTIQFSSITSLVFILSSTPTQAMFKTPKNLSGPDYGKNVRRLVSFFENTSSNTISTSSTVQTNLKNTSKLRNTPTSTTPSSTVTSTITLSPPKKTYVSKLYIPIYGKSNDNNQDNISNSNKNDKSSINTAKYNDIFGIYTTGSTTTFYNTNTSNAANNFKSNYNPFKNDITTTNTNPTLNTKNSSTNNNSFNLDITLNNSQKSKPLYFSKTRLQNLESEVKVFTASVIKQNLPRGSSGRVELRFDQKLNKELNLTLSKFVYKSAMDSIEGYLNNKNN